MSASGPSGPLVIDFDQVCGRLHGLIGACISDSLVFNVAIPFDSLHAG